MRKFNIKNVWSFMMLFGMVISSTQIDAWFSFGKRGMNKKPEFFDDKNVSLQIKKDENGSMILTNLPPIPIKNLKFPKEVINIYLEKAQLDKNSKETKHVMCINWNGYIIKSRGLYEYLAKGLDDDIRFSQYNEAINESGVLGIFFISILKNQKDQREVKIKLINTSEIEKVLNYKEFYQCLTELNKLEQKIRTTNRGKVFLAESYGMQENLMADLWIVVPKSQSEETTNCYDIQATGEVLNIVPSHLAKISVRYDSKTNSIVCSGEPFLFTVYDGTESDPEIWEIDEMITGTEEQSTAGKEVIKLNLKNGITTTFDVVEDLNKLGNQKEFPSVSNLGRTIYRKDCGFILCKTKISDGNLSRLKEITEYLKKRYANRTFKGLMELIQPK